jgi:hypothetical protein
VGDDGRVRADAIDAGMPVEVECPSALPADGDALRVVVPSGLTPPLLLFAASGDALPPHLSRWSARAADGTASGSIDDLSGMPVDLPSAPLTVTFPVG